MNINKETLCLIIDIFEDFLDEKGIKINNPEKEEPENNAQIYGSDFDCIMERLQELFANSGIHFPYAYDNETTEPEPIEDLTIYVPAYKDIIHISEGSGGGLSAEDISAGYADYINYWVFDAEGIDYEVPSSDGGMVMIKVFVKEAYNSLKDAVPEILDNIYGNKELTWVEISGGKEWR